MPEKLTPEADIADVQRLVEKFYGLQTPESIMNAQAQITESLGRHGITFEGSVLPVSLIPTIVPAYEVAGVAEAGRVIRKSLNRALEMFVDEHRKRRFDGMMHRLFVPYYKWWDVIAGEVRRNEHIQLMRYDAVRSHHGRWQFMETNADCPGGTIHCARVRSAWLETDLGRSMCGGESIDDHTIDDPSGFVRFMARRAAEIHPDAPNIAILNYRGKHKNELASLQRCHAALREKNAIENGQLLIGDLRDLQRDGDRFALDGVPIALIYNKLPAMTVYPAREEAATWVAAALSPGVEFLNSLGATYLAEAKRVLALLSDPRWRSELSLTESEISIITKYVPFTRLLEEILGSGPIVDCLPLQAQHSFVLKADRLTRGNGVFLGDNLSETEWFGALETTRGHHGVIQAKCDLPLRKSLQFDANQELSEVTEFFGVDVFFFGGDFAGIVSRSHTDQVFNVGNGGRESVVLIANGTH